MKTNIGAALLTLTLATGSVFAADDVPTAAQYSGFLADYSKLQPATDREGILLFVDKAADYSGYTKITFDPVEVYLTPNPEYKGLQPDALKQMTDGFLASFKKALEPDYQIVDAAGPGVLRVRVAITGVQTVKTSLRPRDFIPIKAVFNIGRAAVGKSPYIAEMTAEMEVQDANGKTVAAAVASRKGDKTLTQDEKVTWKEMQSITDYWAKGMRQRLDELRGVTAKK
jgi:uncharacterized protein DUF3313